MSAISGKNILLGVTGGIAAYKAAELVRRLRTAGAEVRVVMTEAATAFVTPLTFQALSGQPVHLALLDSAEEAAMGHIHLARWADRVLIAPATADCIARLRAGLGDDLLSTLCLATTAPVLLAPAMNQAMWRHPATRDNVATLEQRGIRMLGPAAGSQACGETGLGRLLEPDALFDALAASFGEGPLTGLRLLISAGPTREPVDPVRYLTNRSSGKMGYALASAAAEQGARITLVSGPTALPEPRELTAFVRVETAQEMYEAILARAVAADIYIGAAAVADYAPSALPGKLKKDSPTLNLTLAKTRDILAAVAALPNRPFTVGFAAETHDLETYARGKLTAKALDLVAANLVGEARGFDVDENALFVCWLGGETRLPLIDKRTLARQLLKLIADRYHARHPAQNP